MKTTLTVFALTVLCIALIYAPPSFAQNFVDGQMPYIFLKHGERVTDIKFSPEGKTIASGGTDNTIKLWDVATSTLKDTLEGHTHWVNSVVFSTDGKTIASGGGDNTIKLWDIATSTLKDAFKDSLEGHPHMVNSVAFSPDGKMIASGSSDRTVKLWDVATSSLKDTLEGHTGWVYSVAFSQTVR